MTDGPADLNLILVDGQPLLLAETTGGRAVHLIPTSTGPSGSARPAIPPAWLNPAGRDYVDSIANYASARLLKRSWNMRTSCGIGWEVMAALAAATATVVGSFPA